MITIFTATYNRAYILKNLFESLLNQSAFDFEWLIVDDGSEDNTKELVRSFDSKDRFIIRYIYKKNEGKHSAINLAAQEANGDWIFIVDSDDQLTTDAIKIVKYYISTIEKDETFAGVAGLRADSNGIVWQTNSSDKTKNLNEYLNRYEFIDATAIEYRYAYKILGDRAEIVRKDILKKYPFPVIDGEHFMQESYLWYSLARDGYKFRWFNKIIYITEYLEDGLTQNGRKIAIKNCKSKSCAENLQQGIKQLPFKERIKSGINYYRYGKLGGTSYLKLFIDSTNKWIAIIGIPVAFVTRIQH